MANIKIADLEDSLLVELNLEELEAINGGWGIPSFIKRGIDYVEKKGYEISNEVKEVFQDRDVATAAGLIVLGGLVLAAA